MNNLTQDKTQQQTDRQTCCFYLVKDNDKDRQMLASPSQTNPLEIFCYGHYENQLHDKECAVPLFIMHAFHMFPKLLCPMVA